MMCSTPIEHGIYTVQCSWNSQLAYLDLHYPPWTTSSPDRDSISKPDQKSRMIAENVFGVVGGGAMTRGMFHTC